MLPLNEITWGADCLIGNVKFLPRDIPAIWPYVTGTTDVKWPESVIAEFGYSQIFRVNQKYGSLSSYDGDEFDVETLAWTPEDMVGVINARRARSWSTRLYGTYRTYAATVPLLASMGIRQSTWWRIADWDLGRHLATQELWGDVYAGQYASPTSNPRTCIPGTPLTLANTGVDLNVLLRVNTGWEG